jgi:hypothetical protein
VRALTKLDYWRTQKRFSKRRQEALEREPDEALHRYMDQIRRMEDSQEYDGSVLAREASEIHTEIIRRYEEQNGSGRTDEAFFLLRAVPRVPPKGWPRLSRITLQALGNEALLTLRDAEDRIRDRWVRRAAEALTELEEGGVELIEVLDAEEGARWVQEHCMGDPELAADSLLVVHPGVDVIGGVFDGLVFANPIWKPPPPKTTLRPV